MKLACFDGPQRLIHSLTKRVFRDTATCWVDRGAGVIRPKNRRGRAPMARLAMRPGWIWVNQDRSASLDPGRNLPQKPSSRELNPRNGDDGSPSRIVDILS